MARTKRAARKRSTAKRPAAGQDPKPTPSEPKNPKSERNKLRYCHLACDVCENGGTHDDLGERAKCAASRVAFRSKRMKGAPSKKQRRRLENYYLAFFERKQKGQEPAVLKHGELWQWKVADLGGCSLDDGGGGGDDEGVEKDERDDALWSSNDEKKIWKIEGWGKMGKVKGEAGGDEMAVEETNEVARCDDTQSVCVPAEGYEVEWNGFATDGE